MGKLGLAGLASLLAIGCGSDPSDAPDGGVEPIDPCNPPDLVGACPTRGVYETPSVDVELKAPEADDVIHYTLDGTEPTTLSPRYDGLVNVAPDAAVGGARRLRAVAFHDDGSRTAVTTHTYVFPAAVLDQPALPSGHPDTWGFGGSTREGDYEMDPRALASDAERDEAIAALGSIPSVSLVLDHEDLWAPSSGIYMRPSARGDDFERQGSVEILFADGTNLVAPAGVSIQGNSSTTNWKSAKLSFRIKFRGTYGQGPIEAALFEDSQVTRFSNLVLDAHLNNTWIHPDAPQREAALYAHDQFIARILNDIGSLAPHSRPVHLYLNGIYWGLYDLHERPDQHFTAAYLGGEADDWDVLRHDAMNVVAGDSAAWDEMITIARLGLDEPMRYQAIADYVDLDGLIDYMLINFYGGNTDWDHHNWYAARNRDGGRFQFFSWDAEHVLEDVNADVTATNNADAPTELYQALLANPDFRSRLDTRASELYGSGGALFVNAAMPEWNPAAPENNQPARIFDEVTSELRPHILLESARWGDNRSPDAPYTRADWDASVGDLLRDYFPARSSQAAAQLPSP